MQNLLKTHIDKCTICKDSLPHSPRPILQFSSSSQLMIIGQAPGLKAHDSRRPWNDPSGDRLRDWLQLDNKTFYDPKHVALVPMGFCYPGKGKSGDLPPDRRCAPTWHPRIFEELIAVKLKILVGSYAQNYYLSDKLTLTQRCKEWQTYLPDCVVLPHPSPRNNIWLKRNDWFEKDVIPAIRNRVNDILQD